MRRLCGCRRARAAFWLRAAVLAAGVTFLPQGAYGQHFSRAPDAANPATPGAYAPETPVPESTPAGRPPRWRLLDERDQKFLSALYIAGGVVALLVVLRVIVGAVLRARRSPTLLELAESDPWLRSRLQELRREKAAPAPPAAGEPKSD